MLKIESKHIKFKSAAYLCLQILLVKSQKKLNTVLISAFKDIGAQKLKNKYQNLLINLQ